MMCYISSHLSLRQIWHQWVYCSILMEILIRLMIELMCNHWRLNSPFTPQISGSHPSLFLNTGHHQSDSLDHLWVRQEQDPSDSPACCLPIQKAQDYVAIQQAVPMARVSHQLPKHTFGVHPSPLTLMVIRCRLGAGSMVGEQAQA